jgi:hypothetical protein
MGKAIALVVLVLLIAFVGLGCAVTAATGEPVLSKPAGVALSASIMALYVWITWKPED